jgi:hypothetical protein
VWAAGGKELFYRGGTALLSATLATDPELTVVRRDTLFTMNAPSGGVVAAYDVMPDGVHLVVPQYAGDGASPVVVTGWAAELRERFARERRR